MPTAMSTRMKQRRKTGLVMGRRWWGGPSFFHVVGRGPARPITFFFKGCGPARSINFLFDGPQSGPVHQIFIGWATARPGPSIFLRMGHGPARLINFFEDGPWPGLAYQIFRGRARGAGPRPGPARQLFRGWAAARPGPSNFKLHWPGPTAGGVLNRSIPCKSAACCCALQLLKVIN